jgi:hypothetical protein
MCSEHHTIITAVVSIVSSLSFLLGAVVDGGQWVEPISRLSDKLY